MTVFLALSATFLLLSNISFSDIIITVNSIFVLILLIMIIENMADIEPLSEILIYLISALLIIISVEVLWNSLKKNQKKKNSLVN